MGQECQERGLYLESKQHIHWLEDEEKFLADVSWSRDKFRFSVN